MTLSLREHTDRITTDGYTILQGVIEPTLVSALTTAIDRLMVELEVPFGANRFLGTRTRRIFNLLARDPIFAQVPLHAGVLPLVEEVLDDGVLLSSLTAIEMGGGQDRQPFHCDDGSIPLARPHPPIGCTAIWALTDFTVDNGATRLVPGSHRTDRIPGKGEEPDGVVQAIMPAGSVLVYNGSLWHAGGTNTTDSRRVGIVSNYCAGWVRQEENQLLSMPREYVAALPGRLHRMVGYGVYRGLIGHVDQVDPGSWLDPETETDMVWKRMR